MHFESGDGIRNANDCVTKLLTHMPNYTKSNINAEEIARNCERAVSNGERKHKAVDVLQGNCSTVYKLIKEILEMKG